MGAAIRHKLIFDHSELVVQIRDDAGAISLRQPYAQKELDVLNQHQRSSGSDPFVLFCLNQSVKVVKDGLKGESNLSEDPDSPTWRCLVARSLLQIGIAFQNLDQD